MCILYVYIYICILYIYKESKEYQSHHHGICLPFLLQHPPQQTYPK